MKQISNFSQTYTQNTDSREFLITAFEKSEKKIAVYNLLDIPTFNFHNTPESHAIKQATKLRQRLPNCKFTIYNNMTFGKSILTHLLYLKTLGATDFIWIQDDEFFTHLDVSDFKSFLDFYNDSPEIQHVNLLYRLSPQTSSIKSEYTTHSIHKPTEELANYQINTSVKLFHATSSYFTKCGMYGMDFTAFICNIDYFLTKIFDDTCVDILDPYRLESTVNNNSIKNNVQRCITNISFFESFNIVGLPPSLGNRDKALAKLQNLGLYP